MYVCMYVCVCLCHMCEYLCAFLTVVVFSRRHKCFKHRHPTQPQFPRCIFLFHSNPFSLPFLLPIKLRLRPQGRCLLLRCISYSQLVHVLVEGTSRDPDVQSIGTEPHTLYLCPFTFHSFLNVCLIFFKFFTPSSWPQASVHPLRVNQTHVLRALRKDPYLF